MTEGNLKRTSRGGGATDGEAEETGSPGAKKYSPGTVKFCGDDELCINTIRCLGADMPTLAKSGHPGAPMGMAPTAHALWGYVMRQCGRYPEWINRDRFVLSNGHACALLYSMLHLNGYDMTIEDLKHFRQLKSKTPGHPEVKYAAGIETTTGPLGQGISNAVGMAIGAHFLAAKYNKKDLPPLFDHHVFVCCGDGCLEEGISSEACSLAGHLGLSKLIAIYDENKITIDGRIELSFTESVPKRFEAYGWHVEIIHDGNHDFQSIVKALEAAKKREEKPTLLCVRTTIGFLSSVAGSEKAHGSPLSAEDVRNVKKKCGLDPEAILQVPKRVQQFYEEVQRTREMEVKDWERRFSEYKTKYPKEGAELEAMFSRTVPAAAVAALRALAKETKTKADSTRAHSGRALNAIKDTLPDLIGGSADLTGSTCTALKGEGHYTSATSTERFLHFGVREHAMFAICNGLCHYGCFRPFAATFLNFITYGWGALRLAALSRCCCLVVATHDSIELGQDGPTHQPVEVLPLCRATPNLLLLRPADAVEVAGCYALWLKNTKGPTVLSLCRSSVPALEGSSFDGVAAGAYVLSDFENNGQRKVLLAGSGSETHFCVETKKLLLQQKTWDVRVVSMPSWRLFEQQQQQYKEETLCISARKKGELFTVYVEAATPWGWDRYFDVHVGMQSFGESAPASAVYDYFGFTPQKIASRIEEHAQQCLLNENVTENVNEKAL